MTSSSLRPMALLLLMVMLSACSTTYSQNDTLTRGSGGIGVRDDVPAPDRAGNFLVRSRALLAGHGYVVATLDAPSDSATAMSEEFRLSATHAEDVGQVAAWLKSRYPLPVWLVGTSRGTLSAANGAMRLGTQIDGLVLTSSVTRASKQGPHSLLSMDLTKITQPSATPPTAATAPRPLTAPNWPTRSVPTARHSWN